jgi:hypothetical protein
MEITAEQKAKLATRFGVSAEDVFSLAYAAQLLPATTSLDPIEQTIVAKYTKNADTAGGPPPISNGLPTVMRVVAWMCHEGVNNNRLAFVKEELPAAAAKIAAPNFLVMDWNHSAVFQYQGDQRIIGVWYKADYAHDPRAKAGQGAWGVLVTGVMFAWANPEIANAMLAEQERNGKLDFSMACISQSSEFVRREASEGGSYVIAHNPIFFTNSALDVTPADVDATGRGKEGSDNPDFEDETRANLTAHNDAVVEAAALAVASRLKEEKMDELQLKLEKALADLATANEKIAELSAKLDTAAKSAETATGSVSELELAKKSLEEAHVAAVAEKDRLIAELNEKLTVATTRITEIDAKEAEKAAADKLAARIEMLPAAVKANFEKATSEQKEILKKGWAAKSDEEFENYIKVDLAVFATASLNGRTGYRDRSEKEGILPNAGVSSDDMKSKLNSLIIKK